MKRKVYILHAILSAIIYFSLIGSALGGEKSVIVGFHQKPGPNEHALIHGAGGVVQRTYQMISAMAVKISEQGIEKIRKDKNITYVEDDAIVTAVEPLPGDEYANSWGVLHIGSDVAHASGNKGTGVKIAVIDTGIDYTHEDLDANYKGGYDYVFNDSDPFDDSSNSHGTHVAGIIAAEQNGIGVVGVAPEAELYAVKVLDGGGFGLTSWVIAGIEWAVANNMSVANLSLEGPYSQSLQDACDKAYNAGLLLVAAAGNTNNDGPVTYPAAYDSVIAVTGTDASDMQAWFSPEGPEVELSAPGVDILSTVAGNGYDLLSGTSQAAPHITGTAALIISSGNLEDLNNDGQVNNEDVRLKLRMSAMDLGIQGRDTIFGYGLVDAAEASLPTDEQIHFTVTRTSGSPYNDSETVTLSGALYEITIQTADLRKVTVDVFESGAYLKDLSTSYLFSDKKQLAVTFYLDARLSEYSVVFTPYGKPRTSGDIIISAQ